MFEEQPTTDDHAPPEQSPEEEADTAAPASQPSSEDQPPGVEKREFGKNSRDLPDYVRFPLVLGIVCLLSGALLGYVYFLTKPGIEKSKARKVESAFQQLVPGYASFTEHPVEGGIFYEVLDDDGDTVACAAQVACDGSYNSMEPIKLMVVMNTDVTRLLGVRVVDSKETPGLGERIKERPAANSLVGMAAGSPDRRVVKLPTGEKRVYRFVEELPTGLKVLDDDGREQVLEGAVATDEEAPPVFQARFTGIEPDKLAFTGDGGTIDAISGATVSSTAVMNGAKAGVAIIRSRMGKAE